MRPTFPEADFYDCSEWSERLCHSDPEEAVSDYVDGWLSPKCDTAAIIREHGGVSVHCYVRKGVSDKWFEWEASSLLERTLESFGEEFGDPDGDDDPLTKEEKKAGEAALRAVLQQIFKTKHVWQCERIGTVDLSAEQVEEMMRAANPDWFRGAA